MAESINQLRNRLRTMLADADLEKVALPQTPEISLYLVDPAIMQRRLTELEINAVWETPAYWCFAWASGQVLAKQILETPELVAGKTVLDFGCGSGLVAIAAKMAGAKTVVACDLDPDAIAASRVNAEANGVELVYLDDYFARSRIQEEPFDLLFAADVLYDWDNFPLVTEFLSAAKQVIIADSRVKNFAYPGYEYKGLATAVTLPDMGELEEFKQVKLYGNTEASEAAD